MDLQIKSEFDAAAEKYDATFTYSQIGKLQRQRVYFWLNKLDFFKIPKRVFEINCGTGYDAAYFVKKGHQVVATDASAKMISIAKQRQVDGLQFNQMSFNELKENSDIKNSELLFSNFGGLNCLSENSLKQFIADVSFIQKQSNQFIGVFMPKHCLMEDIYHFLKFDFKKIGRRNSDEGLTVDVDEQEVQTYYHSPKLLKKLLKKEYKICLIKPVAFLLPPSYMEPFFNKYPFLLRILNTLEKLFGGIRSFAKYSDHYILIAEKK